MMVIPDSQPPSSAFFESLFSFDLATMTWTRLAAAAVPRPPARSGHGLTSWGGQLYLHGGVSGLGNVCLGYLMRVVDALGNACSSYNASVLC
jgi:hypothetical protein